MNVHSADQLHQIADCLFTPQDVQRAIASIAADINQRLATPHNLLVLCLLKGGIVFTGQLLPRLTMQLELDYVHVTRYDKNNVAQPELLWKACPSLHIEGRDILLCDDIFDEGKTLRDLVIYLQDKGARSIYCAVLADKIHDRKPVDFKPDFIGLALPDRYVFGMGMDYSGHWRNADGIFALKESNRD